MNKNARNAIMANDEHISILKSGVAAWNDWYASTNHRVADLCGADLSGMKLNSINFHRANLKGAILRNTQLQYAYLKDADLTGAILDGTNLVHANARGAIFNMVVANRPNFAVSTLRQAKFQGSKLFGARFHRAYLRDTDLSDAAFIDCWLRFATLNGATCLNTDFAGSDLRYASMVKTDLKAAKLTDVCVFGISAWGIETDANTVQDLIVGNNEHELEAQLRTHDLRTAQLLSLMLDSAGVRTVIDSVSSKLVLILGSFSPAEKGVLDALRLSLQNFGYVAVEFDFERPHERDYAETVLILVGMSRFVVADFTNSKEVRAEVGQARRQYPRVPFIPIVMDGAPLPITMANSFNEDELRLLVTYRHANDLVQKVLSSIIEPAEKQAQQIARDIASREDIIRGTSKFVDNV